MSMAFSSIWYDQYLLGRLHDERGWLGKSLPWTSLLLELWPCSGGADSVFSREDALCSLGPPGLAEPACCRLVLALALMSLASEDSVSFGVRVGVGGIEATFPRFGERFPYSWPGDAQGKRKFLQTPAHLGVTNVQVRRQTQEAQPKPTQGLEVGGWTAAFFVGLETHGWLPGLDCYSQCWAHSGRVTWCLRPRFCPVQVGQRLPI